MTPSVPISRSDWILTPLEMARDGMRMLEDPLPESFIEAHNLMTTGSYLIPGLYSSTAASGEETA